MVVVEVEHFHIGHAMNRETRDAVLEHCKRKIANLLGTVECAEVPRDKRDWDTACKLLGKYSYLVDIVMHLLRLDFNIDDYEEFDRVCGRVLWENFRHMRGDDLPRPPYGRIVFD